MPYQSPTHGVFRVTGFQVTKLTFMFQKNDAIENSQELSLVTQGIVDLQYVEPWLTFKVFSLRLKIHHGHFGSSCPRWVHRDYFALSVKDNTVLLVVPSPTPDPRSRGVDGAVIVVGASDRAGMRGHLAEHPG